MKQKLTLEMFFPEKSKTKNYTVEEIAERMKEVDEKNMQLPRSFAVKLNSIFVENMTRRSNEAEILNK